MISVTAWSPSVAGQVLKLLLPVKIRGKQDSYLNSSSLHLKDKLLLGDFKLHFKLICFLCWSWQLWSFCLTKMDQGRGLSSSCSLLLLYICKYLSFFFVFFKNMFIARQFCWFLDSIPGNAWYKSPISHLIFSLSNSLYTQGLFIWILYWCAVCTCVNIKAMQ